MDNISSMPAIMSAAGRVSWLAPHLSNQPLPVSAVSSQSQPTEFFRPESIVDFKQKRERIGVVGNEKEWRNLLRLHPDFEGRTRIGYPGQHFPLVVRSVSVLGKVFHVIPRFPAHQQLSCPPFAGQKILRFASSSSSFLASASTMAWHGFS